MGMQLFLRLDIVIRTYPSELWTSRECIVIVVAGIVETLRKRV